MTQSNKNPRAAFGAPAVLKKEVEARQMLKMHIMKHPLLIDVSMCSSDQNQDDSPDKKRSAANVLTSNQRGRN